MFYAQQIGQLTLSSVTATDVSVTSNSGFINGKGRFLYADMNQYFKLVVDASTFTCSSTVMTSATEEAILLGNNWSKGSAFFMNDQGFKVEAYITSSIF